MPSSMLCSMPKSSEKQTPREPSASHPFLNSENDTVFGVAATLTGLWKVESSRPALERILNDDRASPVRSKAVLEALIALGGEKTNSHLNQLFGNPKTPYGRKAMVVTGQSKAQPILAARRAVKLLQKRLAGKTSLEFMPLFSATAERPGPWLPKSAKSNYLNPLPCRACNWLKVRPPGPRNSFLRSKGWRSQAHENEPQPFGDGLHDRACRETGRCRSGEKIYRRENLQCVACHAIGEVGGVIGPNMVSIGASAPLDYLIESLLEPSKKIKEGYHTNLVTLKNGDAHAGGIVSESKTELVIRDLTGKHNRIAKAGVAKQNDFSGFPHARRLDRTVARGRIRRSCPFHVGTRQRRKIQDHHQPLRPSLGGLARRDLPIPERSIIMEPKCSLRNSADTNGSPFMPWWEEEYPWTKFPWP